MSTLPIPFSHHRQDPLSARPQRVLRRGGLTTPLAHEVSLVDYARRLKHWWWLAALTWLVTVGVVATVTLLQTPMYTSSATVLIRSSSSAQLFPVGGTEVEPRTMTAEADFLQSSRYRLEAQIASPGDDDVVIDVGDTDAALAPSAITFTAVSASPRQAAHTAHAWAQTYVDMRHDLDVAEVHSTITSLEAAEKALSTERDRVAQPIARLDEEVAVANDPATVATLSAQRLTLIQTLNGQLQPIDARLSAIATSLAELDLMTEMLTNAEVSARVNVEAVVPRAPSSPNPRRNLALAALTGAALAAAAVALAASFDDRLRTTDDADDATGLTNLAGVPFTRTRQPTIDLPPGSATAEAFQRIVSAIDFTAAVGRDHQVLLITSPQAGEAKTATAARLSMALAAQGRNVLVVGGDLRHPSLATVLGAESKPGLADYLSDDDIEVEQCLHRVEGRSRLVIMPAGDLHEGCRPDDAIRSQDLRAVIDKMRDFCDHIVIDSPPLLGVVDTLELLAVSDAVILSLSANASRGRTVRQALRILDEADTGEVLGYVFNGVDQSHPALDSF